jgi:hypothetical protein
MPSALVCVSTAHTHTHTYTYKRNRKQTYLSSRLNLRAEHARVLSSLDSHKKSGSSVFSPSSTVAGNRSNRVTLTSGSVLSLA